MSYPLALLSLLTLGSAVGVAQAQAVVQATQRTVQQPPEVGLSGSMGDKAVLIINGQLHTMSTGAKRSGVTLISVGENQATVEIDGQRQLLILGASSAQVTSVSEQSSSGGKIILTAGSGGHFLTLGLVNGRTIQFILDTGATSVTLSEQDAAHIGINWRNGQKISASTANGQVMAYRVRLNTISIQNVQVYDIDATIVPTPMPYALLGNSFLTRFQMKRVNDQMTLEKRL